MYIIPDYRVILKTQVNAGRVRRRGLAIYREALKQLSKGVIADQIGCTKTVLIGSAAMSLSFIGVAFSPGYSFLAVMIFILGVSSGIYVTAGYFITQPQSDVPVS